MANGEVATGDGAGSPFPLRVSHAGAILPRATRGPLVPNPLPTWPDLLRTNQTRVAA